MELMKISERTLRGIWVSLRTKAYGLWPLHIRSSIVSTFFSTRGFLSSDWWHTIDDDYSLWSHRYHEATIALENREEQIEEVSNELEQDLRLLGATAIEDKLQDGVPEAIADLKRAGIRIWVATGDKLETAIGARTFRWSLPNLPLNFEPSQPLDEVRIW